MSKNRKISKLPHKTGIITKVSADKGLRTIYIKKSEEEEEPDIYVKPPYLENVKLIKVIDKNGNE